MADKITWTVIGGYGGHETLGRWGVYQFDVGKAVFGDVWGATCTAPSRKHLGSRFKNAAQAMAAAEQYLTDQAKQEAAA